MKPFRFDFKDNLYLSPKSVSKKGLLAYLDNRVEYLESKLLQRLKLGYETCCVESRLAENKLIISLISDGVKNNKRS